MKKMRLHIWILLGVYVVLLILGSFLDLQVSQGLNASKNNGFGLFFAAFGGMPGIMLVPFVGGGCIALALKKQYHKVLNVFFIIFAVACLVVGTYYAGREIFGPNGFTNDKLYYLGFVIVLPFMLGGEYLGYYVAKRSKNPHLFFVLAVFTAVMFIALVPFVALLKVIFHRPRFRIVSDDSLQGIVFHNWWERSKDYKDLMALNHLASEEFKSFPSGHAGYATLLIIAAVFIPPLDESLKKIQVPLFYVAFVYSLFVSFTRILVAAHFLSDVSMGSLIGVATAYVGNEIVIAHTKKVESKVVVE